MEKVDVNGCVGSGLCCKKAPCGYGFWNEDKTRCHYLNLSYGDGEIEIFNCGNFEHIKKQPGNEMMPAFGAGCCMGLFNTDRNKIIRAIKSGDEKVIEVMLKRL